MSTTCRALTSSACLRSGMRSVVSGRPFVRVELPKKYGEPARPFDRSILPDSLVTVDQLTRWYGSEALELIGDHLDHPGEGQLSGRRKTGALQ